MLKVDRGHYDLLYKASDIAEMARPALSNPEIRLLSNQPTFLATANAAYSHTADLDALFDLPGFTMGMAPSFSTLPYHPPQSEPSPPQKTLSPTTSIKEGLSPVGLSPVGHSPTSQATSSSSPADQRPADQRPAEPKTQPVGARFVFSQTQFDFDFDHLETSKGTSAERETANLVRE